MSELEQIAQALLEASRDLEEALEARDAGGLEDATARRLAAFEALEAHGAPVAGRPASPALRERLREVREIDARVLDRAPRLCDLIREERALVGAARHAAQAVRTKDAPRFLDVRA